jgi:hypothetical protein
MDSKFLQLQEAIRNAIRDMSPEDFARHPEGKWSSAEILDHLNLTYLGTIKNGERCLATGKPGSGSGRRTRRWRRRLIVWVGLFPPGRRAPERVCPRGTPVQQVKGEILHNIARMDEVICKLEERFGRRLPVADHPVLGPLTAGEWRKFHLVHGKHHARQIMKLRLTR